MAALVKPWNDNSGDTFAVVYNPEGGEATFTSVPNLGERRETFVKVVGAEETIGILVRQGSQRDEWSSYAEPIDRGSIDNVSVKCLVCLDKDGSPCTINLEREHE